PDTYLFAKGSSDVNVLRRAYRAMQRHLQTEWDARTPNVPYRTPYEALIMASIIEKETGRATERDQIGGVLVNRLRIGMRLPVDPGTQAGLDDVPSARRPMKFRTLEGVDGAGKSTHIEFIADAVRTKSAHVIVTREPGGTDLAERLRQTILAEPMPPVLETL